MTVWSMLNIEMGSEKLIVLWQWFEMFVWMFGLFGFDPFISCRKMITAESIVRVQNDQEILVLRMSSGLTSDLVSVHHGCGWV